MRRTPAALTASLGLLLCCSPISAQAAPAAPVERAAASAHARSAAALPSERTWLADVHAAMAGSRVRVTRAAAAATTPLAVNLDIDNTSLATVYDRGQPVRAVLRFARSAQRHGVAVFFNTGRRSDELGRPTRALVRAGFPVTGVCGRRPGGDLVRGKEACRASFVAAGYTIIANVGNSPTDFVGDDQGRAFVLPSYGGRLG